MRIRSWLAFLLILHSSVASDAIDRTFRPGAKPILGGPDGPVLAMVRGPGDTLVIAGDFLRVSGVQRATGIRRAGLARLRFDGSLDPDFQPGAGPEGLICSLTAETDGALLVAGEFGQWNQAPVAEPLIRLQANGSIDASFVPVASGLHRINQVLALPGGALLVRGQQTSNGTVRTVLQRRLPLGAVDPGAHWVLPESVVIHGMAANADGAVWLAGRFTEFLGVPRTNLVRLTPSLEVDRTWDCPAASGTTELRTVAVGDDGRIAVGGSVPNPFPVGYLAVLLANAQPDPTFSPPAWLDERVDHVVFDAGGGLAVTTAYSTLEWTAQLSLSPTGGPRRTSVPGRAQCAPPLPLPDGRILWPLDGVSLVDGAVRSWLWRSLPDASVDTNFFPNARLDPDVPISGHPMAILPNGEFVTRGRFGLETNSNTGATGFLQHLVRLDLGGSPVGDFDPHLSGPAGINVLRATAASGVIVAGSFARLNWETASPMVAILRKDGTRDTAFDSRMRTLPGPENWWIAEVWPQPDGRLVLGGKFSLTLPGLSSPVLFHRLLADGTPDPGFKPIVARSGSLNVFLPLEPDRFLVWCQIDTLPTALFAYTAQGASNAAPAVVRWDGPPRVNAMARTPDGGVLLAGQFDQVGGLARPGLARLRPDLTVDPDFIPVREINGAVYAVAPLTDGRILVGGDFTRWDGTPARRLILLDSQGRPDPSLSLGTGPDDLVQSLQVQSDGPILIGGRFGSIDGSGPSRLARLNLPPAAPAPARVLRQPRSRILTSVAGSEVLEAGIQGTPPLEIRWYRNGVLVPVSGGVVESGVARLSLSASDLAVPATYHVEIQNASGRERSVGVVAGLASGTLDPNFTTNSLTGLLRLKEPAGVPVAVTGMFAFRDAAGRAERILLVGNFTQYDGELSPGLVLIRPDGTRDPTWLPPAGLSGSTVAAAEFLPNRSVFLTGRFTRANGAPRDVVIRLKADGSVDEAFDPGDELTLTPPEGFPPQTTAVSLAVDGDGVFFATPPGAVLADGFVRRLDAAGRTDLNFRATNAAFFGSPIVMVREAEPDGGLLVGGPLFAASRRSPRVPVFRGVARLQLDGQLDLEFNEAPRRPDVSAQGDVTAILRRGTNLWVGGNFAEFDRASGPWVRLDAQGIADTNFAIRFSGTTRAFPRRPVRGAGFLPSGRILLNLQVTSTAYDSVQRISESGDIDGTSGGPADRLRISTGPVLALDDHAYLAPITLRETLPFGGVGPGYQTLGRFSLSALSASYTNSNPPRIVSGLSPVTLSVRPGFREPLVLSAVVQADPSAVYRWYHREVLIPEATGASWTIPDPLPGHAGEYRLEVESSAGVAQTSTVVAIVPETPELPRLGFAWGGGERPLRIRFTPVPGQTVRWESSPDLILWTPVTDPEAVVAEGELAPEVGSGPGYFRIVAVP